MFGWYSGKQAKLNGTCHYAKADGTIVAVTYVTLTNVSTTGFDDMVYLGEVHHWVKDGKKGRAEKSL